MPDERQSLPRITKIRKTDLQVPFTKIELTNGEVLVLPAISEPDNGPVPAARTDFTPDGEGGRVVARTQLDLACAGEVTAQMRFAAARESAGLDAEDAVSPELVRQRIAEGRAVLPANPNHPECEPMVIGRDFQVKINANLGASAVASDPDDEVVKLTQALKYGADTVMDLSAGIAGHEALRRRLLRASPVPVGTVPVYEALDRAGGRAESLTWELLRDTCIDQARQGVDYFTIHAGLRRHLLPHAASRIMGIVSRGGALMAAAMCAGRAENFAYEHFDELLELCHRYDVALSLGDGLRPGCLADACDKAQYGELEELGHLAERCLKAGVQCIIEGPGHVPMNAVKENQRLQEILCHGAPFYTLGPVVTDIAPGFDHISSAIGGCAIASFGAAMLCYVTPSEHLALPDHEDVRLGLITYKLAAHAADVARGVKGARLRDDAMARARAEFRWEDQFALSLDPEYARQVWAARMPDDCGSKPRFCSMCGPAFCPVRFNRTLKESFA